MHPVATNGGMTTSPPSRAQDHDPESPSLGRRPGPWPPRMDSNQNPRAMGSWARRTGFRSNMSGESASTVSDTEINSNAELQTNGKGHKQPLGNADPLKNRLSDSSSGTANGSKDPEKGNKIAASAAAAAAAAGQRNAAANNVIPVNAVKRGADVESMSGMQSNGRDRNYRESEVDTLSQSQDADDIFMAKQSHMKYEITETPGLVPLIFYGMQHYFSIAGSLLLLPLIFVPAMGGSDEDVAKVISTMLLVTGITTLLHTYFGSRLPLIQGPSYVYLAPILAIIFSPDFASVTENRFKHIMKELQGAVIISSVFQVVIGYSGLMSIVLRIINPVVVAPTVAAVGLAFFSYGFPVLGSCVEIGLPQIMILLFFALYLRKISMFGHRIFQVYAVPLGVGIIWAYAFLLTEAGAYNYKGCNMKIPSSDIVTQHCKRHVYTMRHCRTDVSTAMSDAAWFRFPYPFQWGAPRFHFRSGLVMMAASVVACIDSVGTYHAASLLVASAAPSPGVVSRSIGLEGITSALAGIWGTGAGATTLTENVHTIAVTKIGSRAVVELGACFLIVISLVGKVGALIASVPQVIAAGLLCFMWTLITALGLSNLRYSETGSSRNVLIVGLSLFMSLSVPTYFQHFAAGVPIAEPPFFQAYTVAQHGPIRTRSQGVNVVLNSVLSMNMVVGMVVAMVLDNTVPGSRQERGVYIWSRTSSSSTSMMMMMNDYALPSPIRRFFTWVHWVGF